MDEAVAIAVVVGVCILCCEKSFKEICIPANFKAFFGMKINGIANLNEVVWFFFSFRTMFFFFGELRKLWLFFLPKKSTMNIENSFTWEHFLLVVTILLIATHVEYHQSIVIAVVSIVFFITSSLLECIFSYRGGWWTDFFLFNFVFLLKNHSTFCSRCLSLSLSLSLCICVCKCCYWCYLKFVCNTKERREKMFFSYSCGFVRQTQTQV